MKRLFLLVVLILCFACSKDDDNQSLPPATQTGAGIFACYVDGKPYVTDSNGWFDAYYEFAVGEYFFAVGGREKIDPV
ncbi:MAG TPA: hypothetical protein VK021_08140 [Flavobacteriaceae bacterium]|nr:hypothetical protein [Flavobacteriaceae bacterium]